MIDTCSGSQLAKAADARVHSTSIATNTLALGTVLTMGHVFNSIALCTYSSPELFPFFSGMIRRIGLPDI